MVRTHPKPPEGQRRCWRCKKYKLLKFFTNREYICIECKGAPLKIKKSKKPPHIEIKTGSFTVSFD